MEKLFLKFTIRCVCICLLAPMVTSAQTDSLNITDLDSIEIRAYAAKNLLHHTASINYISTSDFDRYAGNNMLSALNASPGVHMEERSPGSYRLNIRGSSVRSPYGVRNVKIYYNNLPFTAPGGASMLNMFGGTQAGSVEIIKGPAGSMYGAGTGGVLLLQSPKKYSRYHVGLKAGSEGLFGIDAMAYLGSHRFQMEHQQYKGYRNHTAMHRSNAGWEGNWKWNKNSETQALILYSYLFYETPGALTKSEYLSNPKAARPASAVFPGAEAAQASITQEALLAGITHNTKLSALWNNVTSVYALLNRTDNPTVQNFEHKQEPHYGIRSVFDVTKNRANSTFAIHTGIEYQHGNFKYKTYTNDAGAADSLHRVEQLQIDQGMLFAQLDWNYKKWQFNLGGGYSFLQMDMDRSKGQLMGNAHKRLNAFSPRIALGYRIKETALLYLNMSDGFSPPAADEVFADNNSYNLELNAEKSRNLELGLRGSVWNRKLDFDFSYFLSDIRNGIVTRRDSGGGNYFVNAGRVGRKGFEGQLGYWLIGKNNGYTRAMRLRAAYANYAFTYKAFETAGNDFSGNEMPGVAPQNLSLLADFYVRNFAFYLTYTYMGSIALNDANTDFASSYNLLGMKLDYKISVSKCNLKVFAGLDNLTDTGYSLGNDVNGFGGRYYNLAPGRNFFVGVKVSY